MMVQNINLKWSCQACSIEEITHFLNLCNVHHISKVIFPMKELVKNKNSLSWRKSMWTFLAFQLLSKTSLMSSIWFIRFQALLHKDTDIKKHLLKIYENQTYMKTETLAWSIYSVLCNAIALNVNVVLTHTFDVLPAERHHDTFSSDSTDYFFVISSKQPNIGMSITEMS